MLFCPQIRVHPSQFPETLQAEQRRALQTRQVCPKFHYESPKQAAQWLAVHEAFSPARTDPECRSLHDTAAASLAQALQDRSVHVIGLGCGGGHKDVSLLAGLRPAARELWYTPVDVSLPLLLTAWQKAAPLLQDGPGTASGPSARPHPQGILCDLLQTPDPDDLIQDWAPSGSIRVLTFLGLLPQFQPGQLRGCLEGWMRGSTYLLLSANLAPGPDYAEGLRRVLPLYQNRLTEDWLQTWLWDLGFERRDGRVEWMVEECPEKSGLLRLTARYVVLQTRFITLQEERFAFQPEDRIQLFFSYRHTPSRVRTLLEPLGFTLVEQWIAPSGEEGVFLFLRPEENA